MRLAGAALTRLPELSVLLPTLGKGRLATVLAHLAAQEEVAKLEVVVLAPAEVVLPPCPQGLGLCRYNWRPEDGLAVGISLCQGQWVVRADDHSYPGPGWAAALLRQLEQAGAGMLAPRILPWNEQLLVSQVDYALNFSQPFAWHNNAYPRDFLLSQPDLEQCLQVESLLQERVRAEGLECRLCSDAVLYHRQLESWQHWGATLLYAGRLYGGHTLKPARALLRLLILPWVAWRRSRSLWVGRPLPQRMAIVVGILLHLLGESLGGLAGPGSAGLVNLRHQLESCRGRL